MSISCKSNLYTVFIPMLEMISRDRAQPRAFANDRDLLDALCPYDWPGSGLIGGSVPSPCRGDWWGAHCRWD